MARSDYLFTSESVSEGHPDKVCDRISDEIVDLFFREGPKAGIDPWDIRAACETLATTNKVVIAGETRGPSTVTKDWIAHTARMAIRDIGYEQDGFHWDTCDIDVLLHGQSADIAQGVDAKQPTNQEEGAGDQGIMFGYACRDTEELMPAPIYYAHKILRLISEARHADTEKVLGPDSKSQVTVRYVNGKPVGVTQIVVSHQHLIENMTSHQVRELVEPYVRRALPDGWISKDSVWHINPTGKFFIGGPDGDSGLTGRKIIVVLRRMVVVRFRARTRQRSIVRRHMLRGILPRTWWRVVLPIVARSSSPMRLASRVHYRSMPICMARGRWMKPSLR